MAGVTKKLTQQYIKPFHILEKIGCLAYKLDVPSDWRVYPVFFVTQLKLVLPLAKGLIAKPFPFNLPLIFVKDDTNKLESFEIEKLLNK